MIAGGVERIINKFEKPEKKAAANGKPTVMTLISAFLFTLLAFAIAQFGLLALVAKGYGFLGYLTIPVIVIPYIIHMIVTKFDSKPAV